MKALLATTPSLSLSTRPSGTLRLTQTSLHAGRRCVPRAAKAPRRAGALRSDRAPRARRETCAGLRWSAPQPRASVVQNARRTRHVASALRGPAARSRDSTQMSSVSQPASIGCARAVRDAVVIGDGLHLQVVAEHDAGEAELAAQQSVMTPGDKVAGRRGRSPRTPRART